MLSRVADSLYWMSRYLERAEHTARVLGVGLTQTLEQADGRAGQPWRRLLAGLRVGGPAGDHTELQAIARALTFDQTNPSSIAACVGLARENARQVRELVSSEMWEQLNRLYLSVRGVGASRDGDLVEFFQEIKSGAHLFQGITDATMTHGEGWYFIQVGRYLERAAATAQLLDVHFESHFAGQAGAEGGLDYNSWVALLKCCTAFEAYCKVYTAEVQPVSVADFLLLNGECPRSVRFAADRVQRGLRAIGQATGSRGGGRAERLAGRLSAALDYGQVDEIMGADMHPYLENVRQQCEAIHGAVYQAYISYPVETVIS